MMSMAIILSLLMFLAAIHGGGSAMQLLMATGISLMFLTFATMSLFEMRRYCNTCDKRIWQPTTPPTCHHCEARLGETFVETTYRKSKQKVKDA